MDDDIVSHLQATLATTLYARFRKALIPRLLYLIGNESSFPRRLLRRPDHAMHTIERAYPTLACPWNTY